MAKKSLKEKKSGETAATAPFAPEKRSGLNSGWLLLGSALLAATLVVGGLIWYMMRPAPAEQQVGAASADRAAAPTVAPTEVARAWPAGSAGRCFAGPRFPQGVGFAPGQSFIGTSPGQYVGLFLADATGSGRDYQHPTWDDMGNMGAFVYDGGGNIYLAPAPFMNLSIDKLENQTKLLRVDSDSAEMSVLVDLPAANAPSTANPFGLVGLFYDCDTDSLYASSVAGSTPTEERGRIFQIDLKTNAIVSTFEDVDAIGIGVYNGSSGKRVYWGSGRTTGIYSRALDNNGHFVDQPRLEFYLAELPGGRNDRGTRITFNQEGDMVVKGTDFPYTLSVERPVIYRDYHLAYDAASDSWELLFIERRTK